MYQHVFEITEEIAVHFDNPLSVKAEATVEAISLSKSISSATALQQAELAKASGWGTLTDIWVKANHQGNTWQHRCYEQLCQLLTTEEIQAAKSATATAYQTSFETIKAMWDLLAEVGFTGGSILEPACNTLSFLGCQLPQLRWSTNLRDPSNIDPQSFISKVQKNGFLKAETTNLRSLFLHLNWGRDVSPKVCESDLNGLA